VRDPYAQGKANPAFSPNGTRVAYAKRTRAGSSQSHEIYKVTIANRAITRLTDNRQFDGNPTWKPDGTRIAFEHERVLSDGTKDTDIFVKRSDGTGKTVNKTRNPREDDLAPAWSPNGEEIAFRTGGDIVVLDLESGQKRNLTDDGAATRDHSPSWSPDGTRIVFESLSYEEYTSNERIYTMDASDGSDKRLVYYAYKTGSNQYPYTEHMYLHSLDWGEQVPR
jgi:Tol biopolymer transport system component